MNTEKAQETVLYVIEQRKRWGNKLSTKDFNVDALMDALVALHEHNEENIEVVSSQVAAANKTTGAAKAREKRAQNIVQELRVEIADLKKQLKTQVAYTKDLEDAKRKLETKLAAQ